MHMGVCVCVLTFMTVYVLLSFNYSRFQGVKEYADELETTFKSLLDIRQVYCVQKFLSHS